MVMRHKDSFIFLFLIIRYKDSLSGRRKQDTSMETVAEDVAPIS